MKKLALAVLALIPTLSFAVGSDTTKLIFDSTTVASAATWTSSAVNLTRVTSVQVFADNTSGNGFRDLTMTSYSDPTCATTMDSVVLRRIGWGTAPTGGMYAPGNVRGYIGPNPPGGTTGTHVLYRTTSGANAATDTGNLWTEEMDGIDVVWVNTSATSNMAVSSIDDTGVIGTGALVGFTGAQTSATVAWGPGTGATPTGSAGGYYGYVPFPVPRRMKITTTAGGAGKTVTYEVIGRGRVPGTFAVQMVLPVCAKFSLTAASGTVRVWGLAR